MSNLTLLFRSCLLMLMVSSCSAEKNVSTPEAHPTPNILFIYVDDLGYGDLSCYGADQIQTPYIDQLAKDGRLFTDAHCAAATCSPSRYALLTGNYAFRRKAGILPGDAPLMIRPGTPTLPSLLKRKGYRTGVIGKWHLGLGDGDLDWNGPVIPGPLEIGFDHCFLLPSTGDRVPSVYVEDHKVVNLNPKDPLEISFTDDPSEGNPYETPTGLSHPELLRMPADTQHSGTIINGVSRIGFMKGGKEAEFKDEDFPYTFPDKAISFMAKDAEQPFFLYYAFHDIHVPRIVHPQFEGKSKMGPRGDAILQMDWVTGQLMKALDSLGIADNTIVFFSS
ncbi:MAG: sulfatase-like hydrolase/transferase, partial [Mameliella sp.]|nr:sulfatase-like hydrolase/transferase [Phaeodactylibacter sp.]